jgi:hypothetical protein
MLKTIRGNVASKPGHSTGVEFRKQVHACAGELWVAEGDFGDFTVTGSNNGVLEAIRRVKVPRQGEDTLRVEMMDWTLGINEDPRLGRVGEFDFMQCTI